MAMEVMQWDDKEKRDSVYHDLRKNGNFREKQAVRFSSVREVMNPEVPGEIQLDDNGRVRYTSVWLVAYPAS